MERIIEAEELAVERAGLMILDGLNLAVVPSEVVGISGPNGSGKTTLLRAVATLTPISSGELRLFGGIDSHSARLRIGMIGHRPYLVPQLTLSENLHHIGRLQGFSPDRVDNALGVVGLEGAANRKAEAASFGMLRRVEIAQQLLAKPSLMLLDEASSGLDEAAQELVAELIRLTVGRGGAVLMVSHDRAHLDQTCGRVLELVGGRFAGSA